MIKKPRLLIALSILMVLICGSFFIQIMFLYEHPFSEFDLVLKKLTYMNWLVIFFLLCHATLLFFASKHTLWVAPIVILAVIINNFNVGYYSSDYNMTTTLIASLAFVLVHGILLDIQVHRVLSDPRLHWWKVPKRKAISLPISISFLEQEFVGKTFDLSKTGAFLTDFVSLKGTRNVNPFRKFSVSQKVRLSMQLPHKKKLHCLGKIRRISSKNGRYPDGIGVQFDHLNFTERRYLKQFLSSLA